MIGVAGVEVEGVHDAGGESCGSGREEAKRKKKKKKGGGWGVGGGIERRKKTRNLRCLVFQTQHPIEGN